MTYTDPLQTILICLCGLSPAVLTETVWAWVEEHPTEIPDRVLVFTTTVGRQKIVEEVLESGVWKAMIRDLEKKTGLRLDGKLNFGGASETINVIPSKDCTHDLSDVNSLEDHEAVADFFLERLRGFTENDQCRLIVSIAGGRKTMSALLYSVMNVLGRQRDRINHILVEPPWDQIRTFFYPGCEGPHLDSNGFVLDSSEVNLQLAPIPFIPLRHLFEKEKLHRSGNYSQLVQSLQSRVVELSDDPKVEFRPLKQELLVNGLPVKTSAFEYAIMLLFAQCAKSPASEKKYLSDVKVSEWEFFLSEHRVFDQINHWSQRADKEAFDPKEDVRKAKERVKKALVHAGVHKIHIDRLLPNRGIPWSGIHPASISILETKKQVIHE